MGSEKEMDCLGKRNKTIDDYMAHCTLCPRACGVNRKEGGRGVCGQDARIKAARADLHMWEEPCISGTKGSGTVFFSGCGLGCVFCQNQNIAKGNAGKRISISRLSEIFLELQEKGANNINLVTAGHFAPQVLKALELAKRQGLRLPVVYNTGSYETVETIRMLEGYVDVYLPDLKYKSMEISQKYAMAGDYFDKAAAAIEEMVRQAGAMRFIREGEPKRLFDVKEYQDLSLRGECLVMTRGVIVRHLILPGALADSKEIVAYLLAAYGERIFVSLMSQYTPLPHVEGHPELMRRVSAEEYEELIHFAEALGVENGFIQEGESARESFIPEFDGKGISSG